jgi:hypothetical protein
MPCLQHPLLMVIVVSALVSNDVPKHTQLLTSRIDVMPAVYIADGNGGNSTGKQ